MSHIFENKLFRSICMIPLWVFLLCSLPFILQNFPNFPYSKLKFIAILFIIFELVIFKHKIILDCYFLAIIVLLSFFYILFAIIHGDLIYLRNLLSLFFLIPLYLVVKLLGFVNFVRLNSFLLVGMTCAGTLAFFLVFFNFLEPVFNYENVDQRIASFYGLTCSLTNIILPDGGAFIRYSGFFDEPGAIAFYGIMAMLLNKLIVKDKMVEWLLVICLLFTFSVAFYVSLLFYFILFYFNKKNAWRFLITITISLILIMGISQYSESNVFFSFLSENSLERFSMSETGTFKGNTRSGLFGDSWDVFLKYPIFGVGDLVNYESKYLIGNIFAIFGRHGLFGFFLYYTIVWILFFIICKSNSNSIKTDSFKAFVIICLNLLQRPDINNIYAQLLLLVFILHLISHETKQEKS